MKNNHDCPRQLWKKMSEEEQIAYDLIMRKLKSTPWSVKEIGAESITDADVLSHNVTMVLLKDLVGNFSISNNML